MRGACRGGGGVYVTSQDSNHGCGLRPDVWGEGVSVGQVGAVTTNRDLGPKPSNLVPEFDDSLNNGVIRGTRFGTEVSVGDGAAGSTRRHETHVETWTLKRHSLEASNAVNDIIR